MSQQRITKQRPSASARRRAQAEEQYLPLDPRDPDIVHARQLHRQSRRTGTPK